MLLWLLEIILLLTALFVVQIPLRKKGRPVWRVKVFMIKVLLIPAVASADRVSHDGTARIWCI